MLSDKKLIKKAKGAPNSPGIYIWKDKDKNPLYIGKAINLRRRLANYLQPAEKLEPKNNKFLSLTHYLSWIEVRNELEAILLEINLIRTLKPPYNILSRDDKRPLFVQITNDKLPRVKVARLEIPDQGVFIGPFPDSYKLKQILKKVRKIFPFCSCTARKKTRCLYVDMGLCSPAPFEIEKAQGKTKLNLRRKYLRNINNLKLFLQGKIDKVVKQLTKEMRAYARDLEFEKAQEIKLQIEAIQDLLKPNAEIGEYLSSRNLADYVVPKQVKSLEKTLAIPKIFRIEGYDIANLGENNPVAAMVVFENGFANTSKYRYFKIKYTPGPNDPAMIAEGLSRRLKHPEWDFPDLFLIDGGKTQTRAALNILKKNSLDIPVIGLAKKFEQIVIPDGKKFKILNLPLDNPGLTLLRAVRDEVHRFGTTFHRKLREKDALKSIKVG